MADYEGDIRSGTACKGPGVLHAATVHYVSEARPHEIMRTKSVDLGVARLPSGTPLLWTKAALQEIEKQQGFVINPEQLVAVSVLRYCRRAHHEDPESNAAIKARWERVGSYAIARSMNTEALKPLNGPRELELNEHNVGYARLAIPWTSEVKLVHLPITPKERQLPDYRVEVAVRSSAEMRAVSLTPYVALHGPPEIAPEKIILLKDLL